MEEIQSLYQQRAKDFADLAASLKQQYNYYSIVRLVVFFVGVFVGIFIFSQFHFVLGFIYIAVFLLGFGKFIFWHHGILRASRHNRFLADINEEEIAALNHRYTQFESGAEFADPHHPYTVDMDVFGDYSLFQYCNRTATAIGKKELARFLTTQAEKSEILARQAAIKELATKLDWRQNFQAIGRVTEDKSEHLRLLELWLSDLPFVRNNQWLKIALIVVPIWMLIGLSISIYYLSWQLALLFTLLPAFILLRTTEKVNETHGRTSHAEAMLSFYAQLIQHIEKASFKAKKLNILKNNFIIKNTKASSQIQQLSKIIGQLNVRYNVFAVFLNLLALWDLQWVCKLEKWKAKNREHLPQWFAALQQFEAINSLATLYYNHPDWVFPSITESKQFDSQQLGHPLIHHSKRVCNDFSLPTQAHIKLLTGSNMAGKSTFLRTVGVNIILAMAGSAVCAKALSLPILRVYTSMRTQDALHESTSSFYAELKRLKVIIEAVQNSDNVFLLLDEILKGTNSKDRHTGSKALIEQMIQCKGAGIIATHDLELGNMEANANGAIENLCMEVEVKGRDLIFDYKIRKGVSKSFNATILMKEMGIEVEEV